MLTAFVMAAALQSAAINGRRDEYLTCLDKQIAEARTQKVAADAFAAAARQGCASVEGELKAALIAFDVKNKVSKAQAATDAQLQIDDFLSTSESQYKKKSAAK